MTIKKWGNDKYKDDKFGQYLCGMMGAVLTTLPVFLLAPLWVGFTESFKVSQPDESVDCLLCAVINFFMGIAVWGLFIVVLR